MSHGPVGGSFANCLVLSRILDVGPLRLKMIGSFEMVSVHSIPQIPSPTMLVTPRLPALIRSDGQGAEHGKALFEKAMCRPEANLSWGLAF